MTPERINAVIAEWCGWKPRKHCLGYYCESKDGWLEELPDYYQDLNAVHEAESGIPADKWRSFVEHLWDVCVPDGSEPGDDWDAAAAPLIHTTAPQRCEALLKTLGKWEDA